MLISIFSRFSLKKMSNREKLSWYQTDAFVVVTVLLKNVKEENLKIDCQQNTLTVSISEPKYDLTLKLAHPIEPEQCSHKTTPSKIEIKLKKHEGIYWKDLEGDGTAPAVKQPMSQTPGDAHVYPTSAKTHRDWDKVAAEVEKEEKEEKLEGDAALNKLFQQIYADADDETKKAMMKSFSESGGTVLSTNWKEVGKGKVDVKPPDGMEYKQWQS